MARKDDFDDDYVAKLLAEDAKKTSRTYASQGLSAFLPKRRTNDTLKPNTRFLNHIVREADSHNAALKRKEELEAERRLRALQDESDNARPHKRRKVDESDKLKGQRMFGAILAAASSERPERLRSGRNHSELREDCSHTKGGDTHRLRRRSRSRSPRHETRDGRRQKCHRNRGGPVEASDEENRRRPRSMRETRRREHRPSFTRKALTDNAHDEVKSQLVEPIVVRGRGAHMHKSGIDDRFLKDHDPSQDVSLGSDHNSDVEDWDLALEAMRDRVKYKKNQVVRMREAGFTDEEISKWEKGVNALDEPDGDLSGVKWSRRGEVREWDIGKT